MIFSLVAMTGLEKCCITSAYLQWLCHSGEQPVAHGPLVSKVNNIIAQDKGNIQKTFFLVLHVERDIKHQNIIIIRVQQVLSGLSLFFFVNIGYC